MYASRVGGEVVQYGCIASRADVTTENQGGLSVEKPLAKLKVMEVALVRSSWPKS